MSSLFPTVPRTGSVLIACDSAVSPRWALSCVCLLQSNPLDQHSPFLHVTSEPLGIQRGQVLFPGPPSWSSEELGFESGLWLLAPTVHSVTPFTPQCLLSALQTVAECVLYYYLTKKNENYKSLVRRSYRRRGKSQVRCGVGCLALGTAAPALEGPLPGGQCP